jgi:hypothetical protein
LLDRGPLTADLLRAWSLVALVALVAEHVWVSADHFGANALDDSVEIEVALALPQSGLEDDLEQEVAQFLAMLHRILHGLQDLVGFLQQVGAQGVERLLLVPRTAPRGVEQTVHQRAHPGESVRQTVGVVVDRGGVRGLGRLITRLFGLRGAC